MASRSFITRPVFALVLFFALIVAAGLGAVALMMRQYLNAPLPTVDVLASYPGANAQLVADAVGKPIEQQVNGVEDMAAMAHQCGDDGSYRLTIAFRRGTDLNMAQVLVQNRVSLAMPILPEPVKAGDIRVMKQTGR